MSSAQQAVAADWHSLAGRRVAPNMRVQRTSPCGLAADAPSFAASSRLVPAIIATGIILFSAFGARADDVPPVVLSWSYEAPEMPDAPYFNATGTRNIPLKLDPSCKVIPGEIRLHAFQYIEGKTNVRKGLRELAAGVVIYFRRQADQNVPRLRITVESGQGDTCCGHDTFAIPRLSPSEWSAMPAETAWVFEKEGMAIPELWNKVILGCE